jgi:small subunit ribosomal protein S6
VNLTAPVVDVGYGLVDVGYGLDLVDGRLRGLELLALGNHGAGLRETLAEFAGARVGRRLGTPATQDTAGDGADCGGRACKNGQTATHRTDATLRRSSCLVLRRTFPTGAPDEAARPKEGGDGTVTEYEILLLLDAELPDERQEEIVGRTRESIERGGGRFDAHDAWGRRKLAYEIDHKADGSYHLLTFAAEPAALEEVSRVLKITDGVLRHLAVRRPRGSRKAASPSQAAEPETAVSAGRPEE